MIKAVIFDCFGVVLADALEAMCGELTKTDPATVDKIQNVLHQAMKGSLSTDESDEIIAPLFGMSQDAYKKRKYSTEVRNEALLAYIKELRANYKVALLTNIGKGGLEKRFDMKELDIYFDVVVASGEVGFAKPEPQVYEITAEKLQVRLDECIFIDDREIYCDGARAVGMQAIKYSSFPQMKTRLKKILEAS